MKIAIGCDHGAFEYKEIIKEMLTEEGYDVLDCGTHSQE
ncbi:MAG: RpiB/LacA/LacB family sugar-phosphate isomerase, partial [Erysipelotrichaceae bacterium]|nr:RpiB/LacA/LacB family sugar-phosphate isomerase [Erysipelotrichaceae bacterium]